MKRILLSIFATVACICLVVLGLQPANAYVNPSDNQNYVGFFSPSNPTGQAGADSDKMIGTTFTTNVAGTLAGAAFYKYATDNGQGYGRYHKLYKLENNAWVYKAQAQYNDEYTGSPANSYQGWKNAWFTAPQTAAAGDKWLVTVNTHYGRNVKETNYWANGFTKTANGMTATGSRYTYGDTSSAWYAPTPTTATNDGYKVEALFKASSTTPPPTGTTYPLHTNIVATTFWVGEVFNSQLTDGSQVCSTYDGQWAARWSANEPNLGNAPAGTDCEGSPVGGCDGVPSGTTLATFTCETQQRTAANNYLPTGPNAQTPAENHFYLDLPYDDLNDPIAFAERCTVIPWAAATNAQVGNKCNDSTFSYMKNRWVKMTNGTKVCYGQVQDAGPSTGSNYHDKNYVFGSNDARPANKSYSGDPTQGAGADVSPALVGCLGFTALNGDTSKMSWQFVDRVDVPAGPWTIKETTSQVNW